MLYNKTMNEYLPKALINGVECFGAKKLIERLLDQDIGVIGLGRGLLIEDKRDKWEERGDLNEVEDKLSYVFDFKGERKVWDKAGDDGAKLVVILSNFDDWQETEEALKNSGTNWRLVVGWGVYGLGMRDDDLIAKVVREAVRNESLSLPQENRALRLLAIDDFIEVVLRACFLSGTEGEVFEVAGEEVRSEKIAEILVSEAKMTKVELKGYKGEINNLDKVRAEAVWSKLRWKPEFEFKDGVKELLQYYFSRMDEENRTLKKSLKIKKNKVLPKFEVEVEEVEEVVEVEEEEVLEKVKEEVEVVVPKEPEEPEEMEELVPLKIWKKNKEELIRLQQAELTKEKEEEEKPEEEEVVEEVEENDVGVVEIKEIKEVKLEKSKPMRRLRKKVDWMGMKIYGIFLVAILLLLMLVGPVKWVWVTKRAVDVATGFPGLVNAAKQDENEMVKDLEESVIKVRETQESLDAWGLKKLAIFRNFDSGLRVVADLLDLEKESVRVLRLGENMAEGVMGEGEVEWESSIGELEKELTILESKAGILQARLGGDWNWLSRDWRQKLSKGMIVLEELRGYLGTGKRSLAFLPEILGVNNGRKEYLMLFQNEMELRPSGGFIGSYGILTFEGGKLVNLEIKDIYAADGQLKGHVEPPWEIRDILGEGGWYMRDANWRASFPVAAADLQWFLEKETGRKVDGVIGVDLASVGEILGVTGEIYVPDFKEKVGKDNLYEQAEFYSENQFFPGSNQKESFLGTLGKQLYEDIKALKGMKRVELIKAMVDMLESNDIQIALNDKNAGMEVARLGWDGSLFNNSCEGDCLADYLYIVEANLGVNKANYFLYRNIEQLVEISLGAVSRVVKINYENTAKNSNWPGGDYKNYMRVYLPKDVNLSQVSIYDGNDPSSKKIYMPNELKNAQVAGKKEVGFLMTVPVTKKRVVEIRYTSNIDLSNKNKFSYMNYIQRQPGYGQTGFVALVNYPEGWGPAQVQPVASVINNKLLFNQKLEKDIKIGVEIIK